MNRSLLVCLSFAAASFAASAFAADKAPAPPTSAPAAGTPDMGRMHQGFAAKAPDLGDVKVPKATGPDAKTIAEIVGKRAELKDKTVQVRGKVVKFTPDVMGKNWVHLRDGSGNAKEGSNDLVVTTKDETTVGAVVVAKGTVRTNVQLGSGYAYDVLVDGATLQK